MPGGCSFCPGSQARNPLSSYVGTGAPVVGSERATRCPWSSVVGPSARTHWSLACPPRLEVNTPTCTSLIGANARASPLGQGALAAWGCAVMRWVSPSRHGGFANDDTRSGIASASSACLSPMSGELSISITRSSLVSPALAPPCPPPPCAPLLALAEDPPPVPVESPPQPAIT